MGRPGDVGGGRPRDVLGTNICRLENICARIFWCFLVNFAEFVRTPFLQNSTERLILIRAVSIVAKGVLANETVNYNTQTKAYVLI